MSVLFIIQSLLSSAPAVLLITALPAMIGDNEKISIFSTLGVLFFSIRFGMIFGSLLVNKLVSKYSEKSLCVAAEFASFLMLATLSLYYSNLPLLIIVMLLRFCLVGMISVTRASWIKGLSDEGWDKKIILYVSAAPQISYLFAGVYILYVGLENINYKYLIAFDAITSFIGSILFNLLPQTQKTNLKTSETRQPKINPLKAFKSVEQKYLLLMVLFLSLSMGGTNYLLVDYGNNYFSDYGGYPLAIILYSIFFLMSLGILEKTLNRVSAEKYLILLCLSAIGFCFYSIGHLNDFGSILAFSILFLSYSVILLALDYYWIEISSSGELAKLFSYQFLVSSIAWAIGEIVYPVFPTTEKIIRLVFILLTFVFSFLFFMARNTDDIRDT